MYWNLIRRFLGNIEGLQMIASSRINLRTDLNWFDETCSNITVEEGDLSVNERNFDQQTHTHHINNHLNQNFWSNKNILTAFVPHFL